MQEKNDLKFIVTNKQMTISNLENKNLEMSEKLNELLAMDARAKEVQFFDMTHTIPEYNRLQRDCDHNYMLA